MPPRPTPAARHERRERDRHSSGWRSDADAARSESPLAPAPPGRTPVKPTVRLPRDAALRPGTDAVAILMQQHDTVRSALSQCQAAPAGDAKRRAFRDVLLDLLVHEDLEDELFYPAVRAAALDNVDDPTYFIAREQHKSIARLLYLTRDEPDDRVFDAQCRVLQENVEMLFRQEERELFPKATQRIPAGRLETLGLRLSQRRAELMDDGMEPLFSRMEARVRQQLHAAEERVSAAHHGAGIERPGLGRGVTLGGTDEPGRAAYE